MDKTATIPDRPPGPERPTFIRLNAAQMRLFADRIRSDRSINITQLCKDVGISRAMFYYITRGQSGTTSENLNRLAARLKLDHKIFFV